MQQLRQEEIYDCLDNDEAFARLPELVAKSISARSAVFHWRNLDLSAEVLASSNYWSADDMARYVEHFAEHDIWAQSTLTPQTRNTLWVLDDLVPARAYSGSTFYNEWIRDIGDDTFHCIGMSISSRAGTGLIGIHRGKSQGAFQSEHMERLQVQMPHVRRLMRVRGMLAEARHDRGLRDGALDSIAMAMITVTRDGKLLHANMAAEQLMAPDGPFRLIEGRIGVRDATYGKSLSVAIAAAACPQSPSAGFVEVSNPGGGRTIIAVTPLVETRGRNVLLLCQPARTSDSLCRSLRALFDLTPTEADVAALLSEGMDLTEIARVRCVSITTIRTQVKAIAAKMGCQRQAEVVAMVKSIPALQAGHNGRAATR